MAEPRTLQPGKYYHIYNRGANKQEVYFENLDYQRFLETLFGFNTLEVVGSLYRLRKRKSGETSKVSPNPDPAVRILAYCLLPNHFHLILENLGEMNISKFIQKISDGHTKYINYRMSRSGSLFQGRYQFKEVKSEQQLWYLSAYVNGNAEIHDIAKAKEWPWSSLKYYLNWKGETLEVSPGPVMEGFGGVDEYKKYLTSVISNAKKRKEDIREYEFE